MVIVTSFALFAGPTSIPDDTYQGQILAYSRDPLVGILAENFSITTSSGFGTFTAISSITSSDVYKIVIDVPSLLLLTSPGSIPVTLYIYNQNMVVNITRIESFDGLFTVAFPQVVLNSSNGGTTCCTTCN